MLQFFNDLKIRTRISLAFVMPLIGLLWFSGIVLVENRRSDVMLGELQSLTALGTDISAMVHELQKERGASALFLGSKGTQFRPELDAQRSASDAKWQNLEASLRGMDTAIFGPAFKTRLDQILTQLGDLASRRQAVSGLSVEPKEAIAYYTQTIAGLLQVVANMATLSTDGSVSNAISSYVNFLEAKERAGQERATGSAGFAGKAFPPALYRRFVELIAEQETYLRVFRSFASEGQWTAYQSTVSGDLITDIERMRKIAIDSPQAGNTGDIEAPAWFRAVTGKIELLKKVEDNVAQHLATLTAEHHEQARRNLYMSLGFVTILLMLTAVSGIYIVSGIVGPVNALTSDMTHLAEGNKGIDIHGAERQDEIGEMCAAVLVFKQAMLEADRLGAEQKREHEVKERRGIAMEKLIRDFDAQVSALLGKVAASAKSMHTTAETMASIAEETSQQSAVVAAAAEEAAVNVQTVAAAAEELSSSITEISRQVNTSGNITNAAVAEAGRTDQLVQGLANAAKRSARW